MSSPVVSVVRRPGGITVRLLERRPTVGVGFRAAEAKLGPYVFTERPLAEVGELNLPYGKRLACAFEAISDAREIDAETFGHILWVLLGTVPTAEPLDPPAPMPSMEPPQAAKRSAAHPRGYRGTKYQPPKPARPERMDWRPALCDRKLTRQILERGWRYRAQVMPALARELDLSQAVAERWLSREDPPEDPFIAAWLDGPHGESERLPPRVVEDLLWLTRGGSWRLVRRWLRLYERLVMGSGATSTSPLAACLVRLVATVPVERAAQWAEEAERQPAEQRAFFLASVLESGAATAAEPSRPLGRALAEQAPKSSYQRWVWNMLEAQAKGVDPVYLEAGVLLMPEHCPSHYFHKIRGCEAYDGRVVEDLLLRVPLDEVPKTAAILWRGVGWVAPLMEHLRELAATQMAPLPLFCYLDFLDDLCWMAENESFDPEWWQALEGSLPKIQAMLGSVPPAYTAQAALDLFLVMEDWSEPRQIESYLPAAIDLFARIQRPPLNSDGHFSYALRALLELEPSGGRAGVLQAPLAVFVRLDKLCRRQNDGRLIGWGLQTMVTTHPLLVSAGFLAETGVLARIARLVGVFAWQEQARVLQSWQPKWLFDEDLGDLPVSELVDRIENSLVSKDAKAVPKALREFLEGRRSLTARQIEGHRRRVLARLTRIRLLSLEEHVIGELGRSVGVSQPDEPLKFALQMLADAKPARRALRRFLHQYLAGNTSYLQNHPANRAWLQRQPKIDMALWTTGIRVQARDAQGKDLELTLEQNPFEILRMGTYVGSCLGLGGAYSWSAVSVLLDINKQVVYARDSQGKVLARQLIAISKAQELVPFEVYPAVDDKILDAFRSFDHAFARALGLEISTEWENEVELLVSRSWWNDGAWDELKPEDF